MTKPHQFNLHCLFTINVWIEFSTTDYEWPSSVIIIIITTITLIILFELIFQSEIINVSRSTIDLKLDLRVSRSWYVAVACLKKNDDDDDDDDDDDKEEEEDKSG